MWHLITDASSDPLLMRMCLEQFFCSVSDPPLRDWWNSWSRFRKRGRTSHSVDLFQQDTGASSRTWRYFSFHWKHATLSQLQQDVKKKKDFPNVPFLESFGGRTWTRRLWQWELLDVIRTFLSDWLSTSVTSRVRSWCFRRRNKREMHRITVKEMEELLTELRKKFLIHELEHALRRRGRSGLPSSDSSSARSRVSVDFVVRCADDERKSKVTECVLWRMNRSCWIVNLFHCLCDCFGSNTGPNFSLDLILFQLSNTDRLEL